MKVSKEEMNEWIEQSLTHIKYAARTVSGPLKNTWPLKCSLLTLHTNQNTQGHYTSNRTKASPKKAPLPAS